MRTVEDYQKLVTSEHRDKPRFVSVIESFATPSVDLQTQLQNIKGLFDLDTSVGQQLDVLGQWIGRSRAVTVPLTDVYFSFDDAALGFDLGTWRGPFDPATGLEYLPDDSYRTLLKAVVANNYWDGTIPGAYDVWNALFDGAVQLYIFDHGDMSMSMGFVGGPFDAVTYALMTGGYLNLKPAGVLLRSYIFESVPGMPFFGFDTDNSVIAGFDDSAWATIVTPA